MSEQTQTPEDLSPEELEQIVTDFVTRDGPGPGDLPADTFFALWEQEPSAELQPEFATSLKRSLEQARSGEGVDLETFRKQLGR
jgi:hypothetical protein